MATFTSEEFGLEGESRTYGDGLHKVLIHEVTLDKILSFLDRASMESARLVSRKWNDRVLAVIYKKRALSLKRDHDGNQNDISRISSVDVRILSSISVSMHSEQIDRREKNRLRDIFNFLQTSGKIWWLRTLKIWRMHEKALDDFIQVANEGEFLGLEELDLNLGLKMGVFQCLSTVNRTCPALPSLKSFKVITNREEHLTVVIQSILAAAPNLQILHITSTFFDLSANRKLRHLTLLGLPSKHFIEEQEAKMRKSVQGMKSTVILNPSQEYEHIEGPLWLMWLDAVERDGNYAESDEDEGQ